MNTHTDSGIAMFARLLGERLTDDERMQLDAVLPATVGTATDDLAIIQSRAFAMADFAVRVSVIGLDACGWQYGYESLRAVPTIVDGPSARAAMDTCRALKMRHNLMFTTIEDAYGLTVFDVDREQASALIGAHAFGALWATMPLAKIRAEVLAMALELITKLCAVGAIARAA